MNKIRLFALVIILLAVGAAILVLHNSNSSFQKKIKNFAIDDSSNVTKIFMSDKANHRVLLQKITPGEWTVNSKYKANTINIRILLTTMLNLEVQSPVPTSMYNNVITRMAAIGVKVEIYQMVYRINLFDKIKLFQHEKLTKTYYVGDNTQNMLGTFMLMENTPTPFITQLTGFNGYLSTRYSPKEIDWRDHGIINLHYSEIKSVELKFTEHPENSFLLTKEVPNKIILKSLVNNKIISRFDTMQAMKYLLSFTNIRVETFLNDFSKKDSIIKTTPFHILIITDFKGKKYTLKTFLKKASGEVDFDGKPIIYDRDRLFALDETNNEFVLIQYFVFDRILCPITYFQLRDKIVNIN